MGGLLYTNLNLPIGKGKYPCDDNEMCCNESKTRKKAYDKLRQATLINVDIISPYCKD